MINELTTFINDLNSVISQEPKFSSLKSIWKPISAAIIQIERLQDDQDKLALIFVSRYLYEQTIQCLWLLSANDLNELERRHTGILKDATIRRMDYLDQKKDLEEVKQDTETAAFIRELCEDLTKNPEIKLRERQKNELIQLKLDENLKNKNILSIGGIPPVANMAQEALPCSQPHLNKILHHNLYKILSICSHTSVPFAAGAETGNFLEEYEGATAVQIGKILTIKMIEYACEYTNNFIQKNS